MLHEVTNMKLPNVLGVLMRFTVLSDSELGPASDFSKP